jgi:hypothetical protein
MEEFNHRQRLVELVEDYARTGHEIYIGAALISAKAITGVTKYVHHDVSHVMKSILELDKYEIFKKGSIQYAKKEMTDNPFDPQTIGLLYRVHFLTGDEDMRKQAERHKDVYQKNLEFEMKVMMETGQLTLTPMQMEGLRELSRREQVESMRHV